MPLLLLLAALTIGPRASAIIHLSFVYDASYTYDPITGATAPGATIASYSGSWSTFDRTSNDPRNGNRQLNSNAFFNPYDWDNLSKSAIGGAPTAGIPGPYPWGYNSGWLQSSGDPFGFSADSLYAPKDYEAGDYLQGAMIFLGRNLEDLGFSPENIGSEGYLISPSGNTVHWSTSVAAVPEPASIGLLLGAAALVFGLWRSRCRPSVG